MGERGGVIARRVKGGEGEGSKRLTANLALHKAVSGERIKLGHRIYSFVPCLTVWRGSRRACVSRTNSGSAVWLLCCCSWTG